MSKLARRLADTRRWLDSIVIGQRLCPFAPPVRQPPALRLRASVAECSCGVAAELAEEAAALRLGLDSPGTEGSPETSLLVLGGTLDNGALGWRELIALSWKLQAEVIVDRGHAEHLQIVLFHPAATHSTYAEAGGPADAGDFTIRSPHPVVQLLREVDVLEGVRSHPDAEGILGRNRVRLRGQGVAACEERLMRCIAAGEEA